MTFQADLDFGREGEKVVPFLVEYDENSLEIMDGYFPFYDVKYTHNNIPFTIECKRDRITKSTGNLAIEFESNGKPSGIRTSTADFWFYFVEGTTDLYIIPSEKIKKQIKAKSYTRIHRVGDNMANLVYLFPERVFKKYLYSIELEGYNSNSPPLFLNEA